MKDRASRRGNHSKCIIETEPTDLSSCGRFCQNSLGHQSTASWSQFRTGRQQETAYERVERSIVDISPELLGAHSALRPSPCVVHRLGNGDWTAPLQRSPSVGLCLGALSRHCRLKLSGTCVAQGSMTDTRTREVAFRKAEPNVPFIHAAGITCPSFHCGSTPRSICLYDGLARDLAHAILSGPA